MKIQLTSKYVLLAGSAERRFPIHGKVTFSIQFNLRFDNYLSKQRILRSSRTMMSRHVTQRKKKTNPEVTLAYGLGKKKSLKNQVLMHVTSMVSPQKIFERMHIHSISEQHDKMYLD